MVLVFSWAFVDSEENTEHCQPDLCKPCTSSVANLMLNLSEYKHKNQLTKVKVDDTILRHKTELFSRLVMPVNVNFNSFCSAFLTQLLQFVKEIL